MPTTSGRVDRRARLRMQTCILNSPGWVAATENLLKTPHSELKRVGRRTTMFSNKPSPRKTRRQTILTNAPLFAMDIEASQLKVIETHTVDVVDGKSSIPEETSVSVCTPSSLSNVDVKDDVPRKNSNKSSLKPSVETKEPSMKKPRAVVSACTPSSHSNAEVKDDVPQKKPNSKKSNSKSLSKPSVETEEPPIKKPRAPASQLAAKSSTLETKATKNKRKSVAGGAAKSRKKETAINESAKTLKYKNIGTAKSVPISEPISDEVPLSLDDSHEIRIKNELPMKNLKLSGTPLLVLHRVSVDEDVASKNDENSQPEILYNPAMTTADSLVEKSLDESALLADTSGTSSLNTSQVADSSRCCFL